jgi:hypothetical protein
VCRRGQSSSKPLCDETHNTVGSNPGPEPALAWLDRPSRRDPAVIEASGHNAGVNADAEAYRSLRGAVIAVARSRPEVLEQTAPATPEWRVRDLIAHLDGVCDDVVNGNLAGVGTNEWTGRQVEQRREWPADALLRDWERNGEAVDVLIDQAPVGLFGQLLFDAWTHEQDLRGAVREPGNRDSPAAARSWEWGLDSLDRRDREEQRPGLLLDTAHDTRVVGVEPAATTVHASRFELLRSMTGRRSLAQMRAFGWEGEPDPARLVGPIFHPPTDDLHE